MDIYFDTETTGLDPERDEVLTLSAVDGNGNVLWDRAYRPTRVAEWSEAEAVNGISPADVAASSEISEDAEALRELFDAADRVVGYNVGFDLGFLVGAGVMLPESPRPSWAASSAGQSGRLLCGRSPVRIRRGPRWSREPVHYSLFV